MASSYDVFCQWFWSESVWLPPSVSWASVKAHKNPVALALGDAYLCVPVAILLGIIRFLFESLLASPFVKFLGVNEKKPLKIVPSQTCEHLYKQTKNPRGEQIQELCHKLGWSTREVERWFRRRPFKDVLSPVRKATECSWRFLFYLLASVYGVKILYNQSWLWNLDECFLGIKDHIISTELYFYYVAEMGMYISLSVSQFTDVQRKDFWHNTLHHISTLALLLYSYMAGYHRIGAVIVLVHDVSDIFLEAAKVLHYANRQIIRDVVFAAFTVTFYFTRLFLFPVWVLPACIFSATKFAGDFFIYRIMLFLLIILQVLHLYWARQILSIVLRVVRGTEVQDVRSDDEYTSEAEGNGEVGQREKAEEEAKKEM